MNHRGKFDAMVLAGALALTIPAAAGAQSRVEDFRLPEPSQTPDTRQQGPVDADAPVVQRRPRETPVTAPETTQTAAPLPAATAGTAAGIAAPEPAPPRARRTPDIARPVAARAAASAGPAAPEALATPSPTPSPAPLPASEPTAASAPPPATPAPRPLANASPDWLPYALGVGGLALLLALALIFAPRRKTRPLPAGEDRQDLPPNTREAAHEAAPQPMAAPVPQVQPIAAPSPPAAILPGRLTVALDVQRLSATLLNAALSYRLNVRNHAGSDICEVRLFADMTSAHGSLGGQEQLLIDAQDIRPLHHASRLASGEEAAFKGELRLPLAQVLPIHAGKAALFVPLLRLRVESGSNDEGNQHVSHHAFVIGQLPQESGSALRPFQLELGPRIYSEIGQRELALDGLVSSG